MKLPGQVPCRLFLIQARESPIALIVRRGPSRFFHLVKWNTETDEMEHGAWLRGKLYPERCDISPDGSKFIYFAQGNFQRSGTEAFTAISKVPWLTALCAWDNFDTHYGGGYFPTNHEVWVNKNIHASPEPLWGLEMAPDIKVDFDHLCFDIDWLEQRRLAAEGWGPIVSFPRVTELVQALEHQEKIPRRYQDPEGPPPPAAPSLETVYAKSTPAHSSILVRRRGYYYHGARMKRENAFPYPEAPHTESYSVQQNGQETPLPGIFNADWDKRGRLIYVQKGVVHAAEITPDLTLADQFVYDLNGLEPQITKSPEWAKTW